MFYKAKRLSLPPETPLPEVRERLLTLFPCLRDKDYTLDKMLPNHHISTIRPEPQTAHDLKNWSVAGEARRGKRSKIWINPKVSENTKTTCVHILTSTLPAQSTVSKQL